MPARDLEWPVHLSPATAPIFVHNELFIQAEPELVWSTLIDAVKWPEFYPHCRGLRFLDGTGPELSDGARFRWRTFGLTLETTITEFEPGRRLAWQGTALGASGYQGWTIDGVADGCLVVTQETLGGVLPALLRRPLRFAIRRSHARWLAGLAGATMERAPERELD